MLMLLALLFAIWCTINILYPIICLVSFDEANAYLMFLPTDLRKSTKMNMFGCVVTSVFLAVLFPIIYVFRLIYVLFHI